MNNPTRISRRAALGALAAAPLALRDADADPPDDNTAAARLANASWRVGERGPLIIVAPEAIDDDLLKSLLPIPRGGDHLAELAPKLNRRLVRVGGIWTLIPATLDDPLDSPPGPTDNRKSIALAFLHRLGPQISRLASPQGIGREELHDPALRRLFDQLIPATFKVSKRLFPADSPEPKKGFAYQLPAFLTASVRLHAYWSVSVLLDDTRKGKALFFADHRPSSTEPTVPCMLPRNGDADEAVSPRFVRKPGDLPFTFETLDQPIALGGAATVDDIVLRIAQISRLNLVVDARLGDYTIQTRGASVRAGDVLDAVCRALGGSIRRLPPDASGRSIFLLAEDRIPRLAREHDALLHNTASQLAQNAPLRAAASRVQDAFRAQGVGQLQFPFPEGFSDELRDRVLRSSNEYSDSYGAAATVEGLPADAAAEIRSYWSRHRAQSPDLPEQPHLEVNAALAIEAMLPPVEGHEIVTGLAPDRLWGVEPAPPIALPARVAARTLFTRLPDGETEMSALAAAAKDAGFTELSIVLGGDPADDSSLAALARIASGLGLGVVPALVPTAATPDSPADARDRDASGRSMAEVADTPDMKALARQRRVFAATAHWLRETDALKPDRVDVEAFARRLSALTAMPGVTGIALEDVREPVGYIAADNLWNGGFAQAERRAFVERHRMDPADGDTTDTGSPALDALTTDHTFRLLWTAWRIERQRTFAKRLADALAGAKLRVPIRVLPEPRFVANQRWENYRGVQSLTPVAPRDNDEDDAPPPPREAHPLRQHFTLSGGLGAALETRSIPYSQISSDTQLDDVVFRAGIAESFNAWAKPGADIPEGFVLDLTDRSVADAITFVKTRFR